jgi:hypothetical protein
MILPGIGHAIVPCKGRGTGAAGGGVRKFALKEYHPSVGPSDCHLPSKGRV